MPLIFAVFAHRLFVRPKPVEPASIDVFFDALLFLRHGDVVSVSGGMRANLLRARCCATRRCADGGENGTHAARELNARCYALTLGDDTTGKKSGRAAALLPQQLVERAWPQCNERAADGTCWTARCRCVCSPVTTYLLFYHTYLPPIQPATMANAAS